MQPSTEAIVKTALRDTVLWDRTSLHGLLLFDLFVATGFKIFSLSVRTA
jgi:hypothetical protein